MIKQENTSVETVFVFLNKRVILFVVHHVYFSRMSVRLEDYIIFGILI